VPILPRQPASVSANGDLSAGVHTVPILPRQAASLSANGELYLPILPRQAESVSVNGDLSSAIHARSVFVGPNGEITGGSDFSLMARDIPRAIYRLPRRSNTLETGVGLDGTLILPRQAESVSVNGDLSTAIQARQVYSSPGMDPECKFCLKARDIPRRPIYRPGRRSNTLEVGAGLDGSVMLPRQAESVSVKGGLSTGLQARAEPIFRIGTTVTPASGVIEARDHIGHPIILPRASGDVTYKVGTTLTPIRE